MGIKEQMIEAAQNMKRAAEDEDWETYFDIKYDWDLDDGEGYWELMKRATAH